MLRNRSSSACLEPTAVHRSVARQNILYFLLTLTMFTVCLPSLGSICDVFEFTAAEMCTYERLMLCCGM